MRNLPRYPSRQIIPWSLVDLYVPPETLSRQIAAFGWRRFEEAQARKAQAHLARTLQQQREADARKGWIPWPPIGGQDTTTPR
jgi:hypothetical protein